MVDGCISLAKIDPIVAKKSLKTSAISAAEEIGSLFTLISEIFRTQPYLRELRSSISFYVFRGFILFTSKLCVKYCFFADLMALFTSNRRAIVLNSNFLHIIPFINFASRFICNPRGVFIGDPFILKWGMLINYFHK